jgi:DNA-binding Lrp family transcriptional regulator
VGEIVQLDAVDVALLDQLQRHPRVGILEIARRMGVARGTASAHLQRLEREGVITGYGPDIDLAAAGFGVQAIVTLEISQGALEQIRAELDQIENVVEAHATTGSGDVVCRVAARSHEALQQVLLDLNRSRAVARSTSVVILSELVSRRTLPLVRSGGFRPLPQLSDGSARVVNRPASVVGNALGRRDGEQDEDQRGDHRSHRRHVGDTADRDQRAELEVFDLAAVDLRCSTSRTCHRPAATSRSTRGDGTVLVRGGAACA